MGLSDLTYIEVEIQLSVHSHPHNSKVHMRCMMCGSYGYVAEIRIKPSILGLDLHFKIGFKTSSRAGGGGLGEGER